MNSFNSERGINDTCTLIEELIRPERLFFLESLSPCTVITDCTFIRDVRVGSVELEWTDLTELTEIAKLTVLVI